MKTIKFRGRCAFSGVWRYGFYYVSKGNHIIIDENDRESIVLEKTVGQFTGLHDKNGKEIYEGDIILFQTFSNWDDESMKRHKATVIFKEGCFMWEILKFGKKSVTYYANAKEPLRNTNSIWGLEVIGNIHENKELLNEKTT